MAHLDHPAVAVLTDDYYGYLLPVPREYHNDMLASPADKWAVLEGMGIARRDDATPLQAWRDAVADLNGVDRALLDPRKGGALDLGFAPRYVTTFVFYLA